jgi:hypothetical protein
MIVISHFPFLLEETNRKTFKSQRISRKIAGNFNDLTFIILDEKNFNDVT